MKLVLNLLICWLAAFGLMLVTLGILGSFYDKQELIEITGGSGLSVYLLWVSVLSLITVVRYLLKKS